MSSHAIEPRDIAQDNSITDKLPSDTRIIKASDLAGHASRIIRFDTRAPPPVGSHSDGLYRSYFLKLVPHNLGYEKLRGEYSSSKAIHNVVSYLVPNPIAWGTLTQDRNMHYLLCDFHEMDRRVLNVKRFVAAVAHLHQASAIPGGKYQFNVTFIGTYPQDNRAIATWEELFSTNMRNFIEYEKEVQGPHDLELSNLVNALVSKVIPRLLRPLETGGRSIAPCLLHGDITSRNTSISLRTNGPIIFDACGLYGHHEYDIRSFGTDDFGKQYLAAYLQHVPASEPKEDFPDRLALYGLRNLLHDSCKHAGNGAFRAQMKRRMATLVAKYPGGYQDYVAEL